MKRVFTSSWFISISGSLIASFIFQYVFDIPVFDFLLKVLKSIWWFLSLKAPIWGLLVVLIVIILLILLLSILFQKKEEASIKEPNWLTYKQDNINHLKYKWDWKKIGDKYTPDNIRYYCEDCNYRLINKYGLVFYCPNCSRSFDVVNEQTLFSHIEHTIEHGKWNEMTTFPR